MTAAGTEEFLAARALAENSGLRARNASATDSFSSGSLEQVA
jgi:hypothetical protein